MRVALVHDWLVTYAGAERVLEQLLILYPDADIFALVDFVSPAQRGFLQGRKVNTSFIQKLPFARRSFRGYLPFFPLAIQSFDFSGYDLVVSVSFAVAKGVITGPDTVHICICCSPVRYAWDLQAQYLREHKVTGGLRSFLVRSVLLYIRLWDAAMSPLVDEYVSISRFVGARVRKFYGRDSVVIYPPVAVDDFDLHTEKSDYYLAASRHVPYKRMDLIASAFRAMPDKKLVIAGDGPDFERVKAIAHGAPNIQVVGHQPFAVLRQHMQRARAFVFAAKEDFGIVVLEAQACGTPVIALGQGAALETVRTDGPDATGVFFAVQDVDALCDAVRRFETMSIDPMACRRNAMRFSAEDFREQFASFAGGVMARHRAPLQSVAAD